MEFLALFIFLGLMCFLFYLAIRDERKKIKAIVDREKAQTELLESICKFLHYKNLCICWDAIRECDTEVNGDV